MTRTPSAPRHTVGQIDKEAVIHHTADLLQRTIERAQSTLRKGASTSTRRVGERPGRRAGPAEFLDARQRRLPSRTHQSIGKPNGRSEPAPACLLDDDDARPAAARHFLGRARRRRP